MYEARLQQWQIAVQRLEATIAKLKDAPAPMGNDWRERQVAYFQRKLAELVAGKPQPQRVK